MGLYFIGEKRVFIFEELKHYWVTGNGDKIPVSDMSTEHIFNILKLYDRDVISEDYLGGKNKWINIFNNELKKRYNSYV